MQNVIDNVRTQEADLEEMADEDVTQLLERQGLSLSSENLEELAAHLVREVICRKHRRTFYTGKENKHSPPRSVDKLTNELCQTDQDWERSATAMRDVSASLKPK